MDKSPVPSWRCLKPLSHHARRRHCGHFTQIQGVCNPGSDLRKGSGGSSDTRRGGTGWGRTGGPAEMLRGLAPAASFQKQLGRTPPCPQSLGLPLLGYSLKMALSWGPATWCG